MRDTNTGFTIKDIFSTEVIPALGCTEPIAIALGAAAAATLVGRETIEGIEIWVDPNIYKNGIAVAIPGTGGLNGLDLASALGAFGGDPGRRLQVLETINDETVQKAKQLILAGRVVVNLLAEQKGLYIKTAIKTNTQTAESVIQELHDNIVSLKRNGKPVKDSPLIPETMDGGDKTKLQKIELWLKSFSLSGLIDMLDELDDEDYAFLEEGVHYNLRLAEHGLKYGSGLGIGKTFERLVRQRLIQS
jgi:L-cysteine desulfidase